MVISNIRCVLLMVNHRNQGVGMHGLLKLGTGLLFLGNGPS
jgi:hypothetical protein